MGGGGGQSRNSELYVEESDLKSQIEKRRTNSKKVSEENCRTDSEVNS